MIMENIYKMRFCYYAVIYLFVCLVSFVAARQHHIPPSGTNFANTRVWGAMIQTDPEMAFLLGRDFHRVPQGVNGTAVDNAKLRNKHAQDMVNQLPFRVEMWPSVFSASCPNRPIKGNDRGVALAHYQIWADFVYQGKKGNDVSVAKDTDLLVVFEDDATITVTNITYALEKELSTMKTDIHFLGWCYGRRYMPMCLHAYVLTRPGATKIVNEFDSCVSTAIDAQLTNMHRNNVISYSKVPIEEYSKDVLPGFDIFNPAYFTRGLFTQKKGLVSFNMHGFQNNAGR